MQFFKHYSKMRYDVKIKRVIKKYGLKGYGLYCEIIESITDNLSSDKPLPDLEETAQDIADQFNEDTTLINEMMAFMLNQGLFELDEITGRLICGKIYKFLDKAQTRSKEIRIMIDKYKNSCLDLSLLVSDKADIVEVDKEVEVDIDKNKEKIAFRENVFLKEKEHLILIEKYGNENIDKILDKLSNYKLAHGKKYKSDYGAINEWVINSLKIEQRKENKEFCPKNYFNISHEENI